MEWIHNSIRFISEKKMPTKQFSMCNQCGDESNRYQISIFNFSCIWPNTECQSRFKFFFIFGFISFISVITVISLNRTSVRLSTRISALKTCMLGCRIWSSPSPSSLALYGRFRCKCARLRCIRKKLIEKRLKRTLLSVYRQATAAQTQ